MVRRVQSVLVAAAVAVGAPAVVLAGAVGGTVRATTPPDDSRFDFVRRQAEAAVVEDLAASHPGLVDVACAAPPEDTAGASMTCYATDASGAPLVATATINDDGGIDVTLGASAAATTTTTTTPGPVQSTFSGTGDEVRVVDPITRPTIIRVAHDGTELSVVPQAGGVPVGDSFSASGATDSRFLVGLGNTVTALAIDADGAWTIEIHAIASAVPLAASLPASGDSSDVVFYDGTTTDPVTVDYTGSGPITVSAVTGAGTVVLVDEPGAFAGEITLPAGPGNVLVRATGPWTLSYPAPAETTATADAAATAATAAPTETAVVATEADAATALDPSTPAPSTTS